MAIEAGARAGMVGVDDTTIEYIRGRPFAPKGDLWEKAVVYWRTLKSDEGAGFDKTMIAGCGTDQAAGNLGNVSRDGDDDRRQGTRSVADY